MFNRIQVESHRGPYFVDFVDSAKEYLQKQIKESSCHLIVDKSVFNLYGDLFSGLSIPRDKILVIEASEEAKSLEHFKDYVEFLVSNKVRRQHKLIAIGGGVIQDITAFLSSTLLRGIDWAFFPTTLLAQADSCIGSKSSINVGNIKNILGTYSPPKNIFICLDFLDTLSMHEMCSGIGEIIKIHAIYGPEEFASLEKDFFSLTKDKEILRKYIHHSLHLKKLIIDNDEFDKGPRLVMNYGHSFGHALESATNYAIPHGIAVSVGCHFANYISYKMNMNDGDIFRKMSEVLQHNYASFKGTKVSFSSYLDALTKDKKNTDAKMVLILPNADYTPKPTSVENNEEFRSFCREFLIQEMDLQP